jgi:bifunctional non-homologous end joining protein LigD
MPDRLDEYRRKRDAARTPEPVPERKPAKGRDDASPPPPGVPPQFVIQQHHARSLHWDLRLERDGVLVSWAVPRGLPRDPRRNHLAVNTEDHPMEYLDFHGEIPAGEYGGGRMTVYDRGTYETEKWRDNEVIVVLRGERVSGRYVLFRTGGKDWMVHRMDPPPDGWTPAPEDLRPMLPAGAARLPPDDDSWGYELRWDGERALAYVSGGRLELRDAEGEDRTAGYPELRELAENLAPTECVLDGVLVAFDADGHVSAAALAPRVEAAAAASARTGEGSRRAPRLPRQPVQLLLVDVLWLDGLSTVDLPYARRRELLGALPLSGPHWQVPPHFTGGGAFARDAARDQRAGAVIAKRLDGAYQPGRRSRLWLRVPVG